MEANRFKNKYRTHTTRLENYDYSQGGYYFITICTDKKKLFFGKIDNGKMILNKLGMIVNNFWQEIPKHFNGIGIDKYVIMPNHIHGIIINNSRDAIYGVLNKEGKNKDAINRVSTGGATGESNPMGKNNLGQIIRWFKGRSTFEINKLYSYTNFKWQSGYYDHVIRNEQDYNNIWDYIDYNPDKWMWDRNNPERI